MEIPTDTGTPERTPAIVTAENRGTIEAQAHVCQITLIVAIVGSACDTERTGGRLRTRWLSAFSILLGKGDVINMVVKESPCSHSFCVAILRLKRIGSVSKEHVFVPRVGIISREVHRETIRLAVGDGVATALEIAVACPFRKTSMITRIEILTLIVLMCITETCRKAKVCDGTILQIEILYYFGVFREVLGADRCVIERVIVSQCAAVSSRRGVGAQNLLDVTIFICRSEIGVYSCVVGEGSVRTIVCAISRH